MSSRIQGISSMATRAVLAQLLSDYNALSGVVAQIEAVGGVDAAKRVQAGEAFDVVVLASDAIERLLALEGVPPDRPADPALGTARR